MKTANTEQKGFLFDLNRCTGCNACTVACKIENMDRQVNNWRQVHRYNETRHPERQVFNLSLACNHCAVPACLQNCPAAAISKDQRTGAVIVDRDLCMGCKYCTWACPYDAPKLDKKKGTVEKCDFCLERQREGETCACVCACPTGALRLGDIVPDKEVENQRLEGFTNAGIEPAVRFKHLRHQQRVPVASGAPLKEMVDKLFEASLPILTPKITPAVEWTLLVFTTIAFVLTALLTASLSIPLPLNTYIFLTAGALGLGLSSVHLGRKERAYRAILNLKTSWLSREIFLFSAFLGLSALYMIFFPTLKLLGWVTAAVGFLSLTAVDRIYQVAMNPLNFHSAQTFFSGLFLAGILTENRAVYGGAGLIKLLLYFYRKQRFLRQQQSATQPKGTQRSWGHMGAVRSVRPVLSFVRVLVGFLVPIVLVLMKQETDRLHLWAGGCVVIGEFIDRLEFYDELDIITPAKQIRLDLLDKKMPQRGL